jgi:hypothetical protein
VQDKCKDQQAASQPDSQSEQVDKRNELIPGEIAKSDFQIVFNHGYTF